MINFLLFVFGFLLANFCAGKKTGEQGRVKSLVFKISKYRVHIHHWLIFLLLMIVFYFVGWRNSLMYAFLSGIMVQGFKYRDFWRVVWKERS